MSTINYDRPVTNLISGLNATGHVTHTTHTKTGVTIHHNAARLSHQGVLDVWKSRPASAHFNVDAAGTVAQYVKADEYAWACGSATGNRDTISIEMCNSSLAPTWGVSDTTWKAAARLAGWLFAHVIKVRPSTSNMRKHSHWYATACPGPHIDKVWPQMVAEAQRCYDVFTKGGTPATPEKKDWFDMATQKDLEKAVRAVLNEELIPTTDHYPASKKGKRHSVLGVLRRMWAVAERDANSRYQRDRKDMAALKASLKALGKKVGLSDSDLDAVQKAAEAGAEKGAGDALDEMIDGATVTLEAKE